MKVTAIIPDELVNNVKACSRSSTITEAITIALKDWLDIYYIKELNKQIRKNPIEIKNGQNIRKTNRNLCSPAGRNKLKGGSFLDHT